MNKNLDKDYYNEREIKIDQVFIPELLNDLPNDSAFYKMIKHELYYYADKAREYKLWCNILTAFTIILPAIVTAISALSNISPFICKAAIALFSALSSVIAGLIGGFRLREQWINYRTNCEKLKLEISKYLSKMEPYNNLESKEAECLFVQNCERIFEKEGSMWTGNIRAGKTE